MFNKILVAIDNSNITKYVVDEAVYLAKVTDGTLMLLHAISPLDESYLDPLFVQPNILYSEVLIEAHQKNLSDWNAFKQDRENWLCSLSKSVSNSGIKTEFTLSIGDPSNKICRMACKWEADIIIIGRRGHRGMSELFLGSVSNYVMHHAPCSVLTVQGLIV